MAHIFLLSMHSHIQLPHYVLHLNDLLHVPSISCNMLSVYKLCANNNSFVEFHPSHSFIKDQATKSSSTRSISQWSLQDQQ